MGFKCSFMSTRVCVNKAQREMENTRGKRLLPTDNAPGQRRRMSWRQVAQEAVDHYWNENSPIKTSLLPSTLLETMPERMAKPQKPVARSEDGESRASEREKKGVFKVGRSFLYCRACQMQTRSKKRPRTSTDGPEINHRTVVMPVACFNTVCLLSIRSF
jgi:hypothetical protein